MLAIVLDAVVRWELPFYSEMLLAVKNCPVGQGHIFRVKPFNICTQTYNVIITGNSSGINR